MAWNHPFRIVWLHAQDLETSLIVFGLLDLTTESKCKKCKVDLILSTSTLNAIVCIGLQKREGG